MSFSIVRLAQRWSQHAFRLPRPSTSFPTIAEAVRIHAIKPGHCRMYTPKTSQSSEVCWNILDPTDQ
ncbi:MAG: hypothetical protein BYD32DRAFT_416847 [Podila humilis]|nr:MAG: hypothetical protein BYD32DRAFT_416847 [Podila humilis]